MELDNRMQQWVYMPVCAIVGHSRSECIDAACRHAYLPAYRRRALTSALTTATAQLNHHITRLLWERRLSNGLDVQQEVFKHCGAGVECNKYFASASPQLPRLNCLAGQYHNGRPQ